MLAVLLSVLLALSELIDAPTPRFLHAAQRCCSDAMRWPSRALIYRLSRAPHPFFVGIDKLHTRTKARIAILVVSLRSEPCWGREIAPGKPGRGRVVLGCEAKVTPQESRAPRAGPPRRSTKHRRRSFRLSLEAALAVQSAVVDAAASAVQRHTALGRAALPLRRAFD